MLQVFMPEAFKIEYRDVSKPKAAPGTVLIKIERLGICGSDIQVYHGKHKYMKFPIVQGHEASGTIAEVGAGVDEFKVGDTVTVQPQIFCHECAPCRAGHLNVCRNLKVYGVHVNGMAQEFFQVPAEKVIPLGKDVSFDEGALLEPIAVGVGAMRRCGDVKGKKVCVIGAGPIGNFVAQVAQARGAQVLVTDINPKKLALAKEVGIFAAVDSSGRVLKDIIAETFGADGADIIIDCAGVPASLTSAIQAARPASTVAIVANFKVPVEIEIPLIQRQQIDVLGIMMYLKEDFHTAAKFLAEGKVKTKGIINKYFDIKQFKEAYEYIDANALDVMKVMMTFNK